MSKEISQEICNYLEEDYKTILDENVERYYMDYTPKYYERNYSLYNAYKVRNNGKSVDIYFGPDFMGNQHKISDQYIYKWMYEQGWHGGAHNVKGYKIADADNPGERIFQTMLYRNPHPMAAKPGQKPYEHWSRFPVQYTTPSPYDGSIEDLDKYDKTFLYDRVDQALDDVLGKYGII